MRRWGPGASYADARAVRLRRQHVVTKNGQVDDLSDPESEGIGVRVLVDGAWGFAGEGRLDEAGARDAALQGSRVRQGGAGPARDLARPARRRRAATTERRSSATRSTVPLSEKVDLCLRAEEGHAHAEVKVTLAMVRAQREHKVLVSSDGVAIEQELVECGGGIDAYATAGGRLPDPELPEPARRRQRPGRLGVRRGTRPRRGGAARRRAGRRPPPRRRVPGRADDGRPLARAGDHAGARVRRPPHRARPRLRHRGGLRGHELPLARRPGHAPLRLASR